jgi:hypothetical protein
MARDRVAGIVNSYGLDGYGGMMFAFCAVRKDKQAKCRTMKTKEQVRMKYRVQENT